MDRRHLLAALLVCLCFGSIHAYGVLLAPLQGWLAISRTVASLGYSIALVALTAGVYLNGRLQGVAPAARLLGCGALGAAGLLLVSAGVGTTGLLVGFGVMFGLANGFAYATSLDIAAAMPGREARALGLATAVYGLGAVVTAQILAAVIRHVPVRIALLLGSPVILTACLTAAWLASGAFPRTVALRRSVTQGARSLLWVWLVYLLGAFAGLMILAHAPSIVAWRDGSAGEAGLASGIVSLGSVAGGYLGGIAAERVPGRGSIALPLFLQTIALVVLTEVTGAVAALAALGCAGLCYGILIAAIPAEVRRLAGPDGFSAGYGKVFTAWGLAGIGGPVTAGFLFDLTLGYADALWGAAGLSALACILISVKSRS